MSESEVSKPGWEHFHHEADMGVRGLGFSKEEAFEQTAIAMTAVISDPATVRPEETVHVECEAPDDELLLVDWLNALIYEMSTRRMLFSAFDVTLNDTRLRATARGERVDIARHQPAVEIKGATYTCLELSRDESTGLWLAQCVVDV